MRKYLLLFLLSPVLASQCSTQLVGVMESDAGFEGVLADLTVRVEQGSGGVWVDTMPLTQLETQVSARLAREVACEFLQFDCSNLDFYYQLRSDYPLVGGPSAGAPMTVCTLAALLNKSLDPGVVMTGTINPDGSVGVVGGLSGKLSVLNGFNTFLVPKGSLINESDGLRVVEVRDVFEAFKEYTGFEVLFNDFNESLVSGDYTMVMQLMSDELLIEARRMVKGELAESLLNESLSYYANNSYYSAASLGVRSIINSYYEINLALANESPELINEYLLNTSERIASSREEFVGSLVIDHLYDLEATAIVMDRYREAESLINEALNSSGTDVLFLESFARTRLFSAEIWGLVLDYFSDERVIDFDFTDVNSLALERLSAARDSIAYAETILGSSVMVQPRDHYDNAIEAYNNGEVFYSLFESLKARAEANLFMSLVGVNVTDRVEFKQELAERSISQSMKLGYIPFLSLSFLEYSKAFPEDPYQELIFLAYASEFSTLGSALNERVGYRVDERITSYSINLPDSELIKMILLVLLGFIAGLIVTLSVL